MLAQSVKHRNFDGNVAPVARAPARASDEVVIRRSVPGDGDAVARLARLEDRRLARGPYVVAERRGEVVAAMPLLGGSAVADPFEPTADMVALLELRARQLTGRAA
jgi:hypothetical protein